MAPATVDSSYTELPLLQQAKSTTASAAGSFPKPLQTTGALDRLEHFDVTPAIGREYPSASIVDILNAENSDELLRELAITSTCTWPVFLYVLHEPTPPLFSFFFFFIFFLKIAVPSRVRVP